MEISSVVIFDLFDLFPSCLHSHPGTLSLCCFSSLYSLFPLLPFYFSTSAFVFLWNSQCKEKWTKYILLLILAEALYLGTTKGYLISFLFPLPCLVWDVERGPHGAVYDNSTQRLQKRSSVPSSVCLISKFKDVGVITLLHLRQNESAN